MRDAEVDQMVQVRHRAVKCAFFRKSTHVQLVENCGGKGPGLPMLVSPAKRRMLNMAGRPMDAHRLTGRPRVGKPFPVDRKPIVMARPEHAV